MSWCPAMIWAMCGGRPDMMASVMKIRRKSCGVKRSGPPVAGSVRPAVGEGGVEHVADRAASRFGGARCRVGVGTAAGPAASQSALGPVVGGDDQRDRRGAAADAADDGGQHVGEFGADDQQPFGVGLGRRDLQQRDELAGAGQPVLHQAVVGDLQQFLDPDAGGAQDLDDGPGPEREVFLHRQVAAFPAGRVVDPDLGRAARVADRAGAASVRRR